MPNKQVWLPDWNDETAYPDHGDDLGAWAWEFLRRNPEYQADYASWAALPDDDGEGNHSPKYDLVKGNRTDISANLRESQNHSPKYDLVKGNWTPMTFCQPCLGIPALDGETVGDYERRTGQGVELLEPYLQNKWGPFNQLPDPASDDGPYMVFFDAPPYSVQFAESVYDVGPRNGYCCADYDDGRWFRPNWPEDIDRDVHVYAFDLRFNIDEQIELAGQILKDIKAERAKLAADLPIGADMEKRPAKHHGTYPLLLRILDAQAIGAADGEIIAEIYDGKVVPIRGELDQVGETERFNAAASTWLERKKEEAAAMVGDGYRKLFLFGCLPRTKKDERRRLKPKR